MLANKKVTVVLPAYNAAQTLKQTFDEIPRDIVDDVILTDDASQAWSLARGVRIAGQGPWSFPLDGRTTYS